MTQIRNVEEFDLLKMEEIEKECFQDSWCLAMWKGTFTRRDFLGVAIEEKGKFIGFCAGTVLFENSELLRIALTQSARGKGYGGKLLDEFMQKAKRQGAEKIFLEVRATNEVAQNLYKSRGFKETGIRAKYYADGEDAVEMVKTL